MTHSDTFTSLNTSPEWKRQKEKGERYRGAKELSKIGADDGYFGEYIEWVKDCPSPKSLMTWSMVEKNAAMGYEASNYPKPTSEDLRNLQNAGEQACQKYDEEELIPSIEILPKDQLPNSHFKFNPASNWMTYGSQYATEHTMPTTTVHPMLFSSSHGKQIPRLSLEIRFQVICLKKAACIGLNMLLLISSEEVRRMLWIDVEAC
ncbi:hypothetical protein EDD22DRAFT_847295 [Suillus occidentalis]|nr:hypothetical protein EDD22DRAFT_847295 [Suillus occidentalis]